MSYASLVWNSHGIGFEVPDDFIVETNNENEFEAGNGDTLLHIYVWEDGDIDEDDLVEGLQRCADEIGFDELDNAGELSIDDFVGCGAFGYKEGMPAAVILLLDTESSTNFVCTLACPGGDTGEAEHIMQSFYAYDGEDGEDEEDYSDDGDYDEDGGDYDGEEYDDDYE